MDEDDKMERHRVALGGGSMRLFVKFGLYYWSLFYTPKILGGADLLDEGGAPLVNTNKSTSVRQTKRLCRAVVLLPRAIHPYITTFFSFSPFHRTF